MRDNWTETTLGEVTMIRKGISYRSPDLADEGVGMPFLNLKSVARGGGYRTDGLKWFKGDYKTTQVVTPGEILICCTDLTKEKAILGYPVRVPHDAGYDRYCISLDLAALDINEKVALPDFVFLLLQGQTLRSFMRANSSGTTVMHLSMSAVPKASLLLPPLAEQRRIVDVVSSVDAYIDALQQHVDAARTARNAVLHELLTTGGDDWTETTLGNVAETRLGKMLSATSNSDVGTLLPYLRNANVRWGKIELSDLNEMFFSEREIEILSLKEGDVLICEGGEPGRSAYLDRDLPGVLFQKAVHRVRCASELRPKYLVYWMEFQTRNSKIEDFLTSTTISHLTGEKLRQLPIFLPSLIEQDDAVVVVESFDQLINQAEETLNRAKNLRSSLLSDLLSGEHEIPVSYDAFLEAA